MSNKIRTRNEEPFDFTQGVKVRGLQAIGSVNSIAALREVETEKFVLNSAVEVLGYYTPGDGGGGTFYWDNTSGETDNGGTVIQPTGLVGNGRWKRNVTDHVNVKWFGAKGDGVTDDTAAIQAALSFIQSQQNRMRLAFHQGVFLFSSTLNMPNNSGIVGASKGQTRLVFIGSNYAIKMSEAISTKQNLRFSDFTLIGTSAATHGIYMENVQRSDFERIRFESFTAGTALQFHGSNAIGCYWNQIIGCNFVGSCLVGARFTTDDPLDFLSNANALRGCEFHYAGTGVNLDHGDSNVVDDCKFEGCGVAVRNNASMSRLINSRFEANTLDVYLTSAARLPTILGNASAEAFLSITNDMPQTAGGFRADKYVYAKGIVSQPSLFGNTGEAIMPDMSVTIDHQFVNSVGKLWIQFSGTFMATGTANPSSDFEVSIYVDNIKIEESRRVVNLALNARTEVTTFCVVTPNYDIQTHTVQVRWQLGANNDVTARGVSRALLVRALNDSLAL